MAKKMVRNGKIELLRFVFCIFVLLFHINSDFSDRNIMFTKTIAFFKEGRIGVQFFFIVTGYLTAASIYKNRNDDTPIGLSTWNFMKRKIDSIIYFHLLAIIFAICIKLYISNKGIRRILLGGFPNILLLQMTGLPGKNLVNVEWYIGSMLMALFLIYPICKKYYDIFSHIVAPMLGFGIIGYLVHELDCMGEPKTWLGFTFAGNYIAVGCICMGIFIYELFRTMEENKLLEQHRGMVTLLEIFGYAFVLMYVMWTKIPTNLGGIVTILLAGLIGISFSGVSYGHKYFNNKFFAFLGKLSLPVYLVQNPVRALVRKYRGKAAFSKIVVLDVCICIGVALVMMALVEIYKRLRIKLKSNRA